MAAGRPPKPAALKHLEGNRSRRKIAADIPLTGVPEIPAGLDSVAAEHFAFIVTEFGGAGILKRADTPALMKLAQTWSALQHAYEHNDMDSFCKLSQRWDSAASKLGIQVVDRAKLSATVKEPVDEDEARFFKVTG